MSDVIREHILVCLSSAPSNGAIIRTAGKMTRAFGGTLTALYVQTRGSARMGDEDRQRLQRNTRLAERLGAAVVTVTGDDVAYQIAEFARLSGVTKVVMGRSSVAHGRLFGAKPLTEKLIELAPTLDIYIIPDTAGENTRKRNPAEWEPILPNFTQVVITLGLLALSTGIGWVFQRLAFTQANTITVYILGVLLTALFTRNNLCSGFSSLAGVLLFNFFFTEPRLSFRAYESGYPVTFAIMLFAGLITGTLAGRLAGQVRRSTLAAWRTRILLETTQHLQKAEGEEALLEVVGRQLLRLLDRPLCLWLARDGVLQPPLHLSQEEQTPICQGDADIARWVLKHGRQAGSGTDAFPEVEEGYLAIRSGSHTFGVVAIPMGTQPLEPLESGVVQSILGEGALALESRRNAREKEAANLLAENERLRANLLRTISHDLRTPLTTISGNAENLLAHGDKLEPGARQALAADIYRDSVWLIRLVENLLAITRLGEGQTRLKLSAELADEVVAEALRHIRCPRTHTLRVEMEDLLLARMDARLISQVIINLVENAIKYTPAGTRILIRGRRQEARVILSVEDDGPGIPGNRKEQVFEMFYTGDTRVSDCRRSMGLGLPLCRSVVALHGSRLELTDNTPSGCIFSFALAASEVPIHE